MSTAYAPRGRGVAWRGGKGGSLASRISSNPMQLDPGPSAGLGRRGRGGSSRGSARSDKPYGAGRGKARPVATTSTPKKEDAVGAVDTLKHFLASRWDASTLLLNLENMAQDPIFKAADMKAPGSRGAARNAAAAMWKIAGESCPNLISLSLASNDLTNFIFLSPREMAKYMPKLQNLSLQNNKIAKFNDLNSLSSTLGPHTSGFPELKEIFLSGNPVASAKDYQAQVLRRFPTLTMLDQQPIQNAGIPALPSVPAPDASKPKGDPNAPVAFPVNVQPGFVDSDDGRTLMTAFLTKFFTLYDTSRPALADAYASESTFSLTVTTSIPDRAKAQGLRHRKDLPNQTKMSWDQYLGSIDHPAPVLSRNMLRVKDQDRLVEGIARGPSSIAATLSKLPSSKHPLNESDKFVVDAWTQPGVLPGGGDALFVVVHGEFIEDPSQGVRSFDRTFLLVPTPAGSPAQQAGWPAIVVSDQLSIRNLSSSDSWKPPMNDQEAMALELSTATRLTPSFAYQCLAENGWDRTRAMAAFEALKASIPPEGFMQ